MTYFRCGLRYKLLKHCHLFHCGSVADLVICVGMFLSAVWRLRIMKMDKAKGLGM